MDLAAGFLFTEGLIQWREDLQTLERAERCKSSKTGNVVRIEIATGRKTRFAGWPQLQCSRTAGIMEAGSSQFSVTGLAHDGIRVSVISSKVPCAKRVPRSPIPSRHACVAECGVTRVHDVNAVERLSTVRPESGSTQLRLQSNPTAVANLLILRVWYMSCMGTAKERARSEFEKSTAAALTDFVVIVMNEASGLSPDLCTKSLQMTDLPRTSVKAHAKCEAFCRLFLENLDSLGTS
jgi:hypothetical protein